MLTEDQREVIEFLSAPGTYGATGLVDRVETHSAVVFLVGDRAWKLKRAVKYDYLDFSTADRRRQCCEAEVTLNRRTAPTIYRGVGAVTRDPHGRLALNGPGSPVEWLVEMNRFDDADLFDRLAERGALPMRDMEGLAGAIAALHAGAARRPDKGGLAGVQWVVEGNRLGLDEFGDVVFGAEPRAMLAGRTSAALAAASADLETRRRDGFVRQCHGDLHLRNIALIDGRPTLFDAVEFNDDIACIDVVYDLAFLLMDLWRRDLRHHANAVLNAYVRRTDDIGGLALLPLFLSCRAAVRAKTSATATSMAPSAADAVALADTARRYLALALEFLRPPSPCLVAIGGRSGSGKSTQSARAATSVGTAPGAIHLRSDLIRKELIGATALTRLPADAYTPEVSLRVYAAMRCRAAEALAARHAVVCDAVFAEPAQREAMAAVAAAAAVPFVSVWLEAPEAALLDRLRARRDDASDATADVVRAQGARHVDAAEWTHIDAAGAPDETHALVLAHLGRSGVKAR
jgi:aminoglycoside phosphotransferase family enzyme/adenylate kinase family enzyme